MNNILSPGKVLAVTMFVFIMFSSVNAQYYVWHAGINYNDTNIKYRSKTVIAYKAADSTLANKRIDYKETTTYNKNFDQDGYWKENVNGKKLEEGQYTYDDAGRMLGNVMKDSMGKVTSSVSYIYDSQGRLSSYAQQSPLFNYTYNLADSNKKLTYTYRYSYDFKGNVIATETDSANVPTTLDSERYDNQTREVLSKVYSHNKLQTVHYVVYDSKGGYTTTDEDYYNSFGNSCSPNSNKTVTKYDKDDNELSSVSITQENGVTTTTKVTDKYKFEKGKMMSMVSVTEESGESYSSKTTETWTYKYDQHGNQIEVAQKGYNGTSLTTSKFNNKNKQTEQVVYGSCVDKPESSMYYTYYPNDTVMKEIRSFSYAYPAGSVIRYNDKGEMTEEISHGYDGKYTETEYTYEYWKK